MGVSEVLEDPGVVHKPGTSNGKLVTMLGHKGWNRRSIY